MRSFFKLTAAAIAVFLIASCQDDERDTPKPIVYSVTPESGLSGDTVVISGADFASYTDDNFVKFNGKIATKIIRGSATRLDVVVPYGATSGPLIVDVNARTSDPLDFTVFRRVVEIMSVMPDNSTEAPAGSVITLEGKNFLPEEIKRGSARFYFTGVSGEQDVLASVKDASSTSVELYVSSATRTGPITLMQEDFITVGPVFQVFIPEIFSVSAEQLYEGETLTLTGRGLLLLSEIVINNATFTIFAAGDSEATFVLPAGVGLGTFAVSFRYGQEVVSSGVNIEIVAPANIARTIINITGGIVYKEIVTDDGETLNSTFPFDNAVVSMTYDAGAARIFFLSGDAVFSIDKDGYNIVKYDFLSDPVRIGYPMDVAASDQFLVWTDFNTNAIKRINKDGSGVIEILYGDDAADAVNQPSGIEIVNNTLYWTEAGDKQLLRGNLSGSGAPVEVSVSGLVLQYPLDVDIVSVGGQQLVYIFDEPSFAGSSDPAHISFGTLAGNAVELGPLNSLQLEEGGIKDTYYISITSGQDKVRWGGNGAAPYVLMQSDLDGDNVEQVKTNDVFKYDNFLVIE